MELTFLYAKDIIALNEREMGIAMVGLKIGKDAQNAIMLGSMCFFSYLAVYVARNILGAVSPQIEALGVFTKESIGMLSSIYFIAYACGQLINGMIGDRINAKYMMSLGLILAGVSNFLLPVFSASTMAVYVAYGATGFFLSMIYAPMTRVVAESVSLENATRCSLGYTVASFLGSPLAGVLAAALAWQSVFTVSSALLVVMGIVCFACFLLFEKKGIVRYGQKKQEKTSGGGIKLLLKRQIVKFTLVSVLTGIVRTTVVFWLTTYISEYLNYSSDTAAMLFTVATLVISASAFIAVFVYERLGRNMDATVLLMFCVSALCFLLVFFCKQPAVNLTLLVLAILASNGAAAMLWSRYCPSLADTGMVSSATGFLDFMSYMAAAISSSIFANAVSVIGWGGLILVWFGLMMVGVIVSLPFDKIRKASA